MSTTTTTPFKRQILEGERLETTTSLLQQNLVDLVDLALLLKQAHWNVIGKNFRSIHLQLDEIIETVRAASDEVAERIAALGVPADGRSETVAKNSDLKDYPAGFHDVQSTTTHVADAIKTAIDGLRKSIDQVGDLDPVSEDLLISISAPLEKHLWMVQAQEA
ncbi:DNA starvation/stationary phase protection protein Dps [Stieleria sp. JC731]|uniref:DNA starvation/stationary phase protection protein Dps n=1 Tax=Pirellulaceae TaxID=2691357 RepID=UPI001E5B94C7|nr:DNA starvation/stationary phase protection protein Dps [Stieleria sp. JC731]MCC9601745.1 DNA starvation/stationary phase protection protein Dps [Stieleria sp. JC731]